MTSNEVTAVERFDVIVVGGGVIGLACAYELSKKGVKVALVDKGELGFGSSYGNAGWITPCFAMPLPMPGMLMKALGWMLKPESPLYIKPEPSLLLLRWLTRFLLSMNRRQMVTSVHALTEISKYSLDAYSRMTEEVGRDIHFEKKGLLMVAQSEDGFKYATQEMNLVAENGIPGRALSAEETVAFEPAIKGRVRGSVYFPDEAHAEPLEVVRAFAQGATANGAKLIPHSELVDFQLKNRRIESIRTTRGIYRADQFVLATGSWSTEVARSLKLHVPVLGGKGYAIITPSLEVNPLRPLMLVEKKIAVTPRRGSVRLAGTLELVNNDHSITPRRVDAIIRGSREFLGVPEDFQFTEIWRGLRPCTPDGVPVIGYSRDAVENLVLATGHQMLGLQSAPGTGRLVADLMTGATPTFDPHPFRAGRF